MCSPQGRAVSFQWKNPDFQFRNPDFQFRNPDFLLESWFYNNARQHCAGVRAARPLRGFCNNVDFIIKQVKECKKDKPPKPSISQLLDKSAPSKLAAATNVAICIAKYEFCIKNDDEFCIKNDDLFYFKCEGESGKQGGKAGGSGWTGCWGWTGVRGWTRWARAARRSRWPG